MNLKLILTVIAGKLANLRAGPLTSLAIRMFVRYYKVNMAEASQPDINAYKTFNEFFTRPLHSNARIIDKSGLICPVDGAVSQLGAIQDGEIFQAKGHSYSALSLIGGNQDLADRFQHGQFITIYLSPRDYHRIHMPCDGQLVSMTHIPGDLFSVNPATVARIPGLFARNERLVCVFDSPTAGKFIMVLVGATIVGSMATVWHGTVNHKRGTAIRQFDYSNNSHYLKQGEEMGRFQLGSTVILLFEPDTVQLNSNWHTKMPVQLGQSMGQ